MQFRQRCIKLGWMESELSGDFLDYPESFYTIQTFSIVQTVFRLSGWSLDCPDIFQIVRTGSGFSGQFLNQRESLQIVRTVSGLSRKSLDCPDSSQIIRTESGLSGQFPNHPDSFLANQNVLSKYMPYCKNFPDFCKNFPGSNATTLPWFF